MSGDRAALEIKPIGGLDDFTPRKTQKPSTKAEKKALDEVSTFPSRESSGTAQMNITGNKDVLDRFDRMCKEDRRSRYAMLEILMDAFEGK